MATPRKPAPAKASRAGRVMHSSTPKARKEAAEMLSVVPHKSPVKKKR
jgi:hypothetical protein